MFPKTKTPLKDVFKNIIALARHTSFEVEKFSVVELISGMDFT